MKQIDLIKPDIYDDFQCKGTACRRTCCAGWSITVGKAEYQDLREKLDTAGKQLLRRIPEKQRTPLMYGAFVLDAQKGCLLQSEEGLCELQLAFGAGALPDVCAVFPRRGIRCQDQMQLSMTLACEKRLFGICPAERSDSADESGTVCRKKRQCKLESPYPAAGILYFAAAGGRCFFGCPYGPFRGRDTSNQQLL